MYPAVKQKKILVIDDERDLCDILLYNLNADGHAATACHSSEEAMKLDISSFDLLLLDVMLPGMSGFELAEQLKADRLTAAIPIIFLTAKDKEEDTLKGFGIGADDYITKPFSTREVLARVKAVLSRSRTEEATKKLVYKGLTIDQRQKLVTVDGATAELTKTEYELLRLLMTNRGRVLSRQELIERMWPGDVVVTHRAVDVNITRIRKKIGPYSSCIVSRQGFGYLFEG